MLGEHTRHRVSRPAPSPVGGHHGAFTIVRNRLLPGVPRGRGTRHARARALPIRVPVQRDAVAEALPSAPAGLIERATALVETHPAREKRFTLFVHAVAMSSFFRDK